MEWTHPVTDFLKPLDTFLIAYFAPCILYGRVVHRLEKGDPASTGFEIFNGDCVKYQLCCCLAGRFQRKNRSKIRERYGLSGSCINDFLLSCFCRPCDLVQQDKEIATHAGHVDALKTNAAVVNVQPKQEAGMTYAPPS